MYIICFTEIRRSFHNLVNGKFQSKFRAVEPYVEQYDSYIICYMDKLDYFRDIKKNL